MRSLGSLILRSLPHVASLLRASGMTLEGRSLHSLVPLSVKMTEIGE